MHININVRNLYTVKTNDLEGGNNYGKFRVILQFRRNVPARRKGPCGTHKD